MHHSAKFHRNRPNHGRSMVISRFLKMAAVRHLGFLTVGNFNLRCGSEAQSASPRQISGRSVKPFRRHGDFLFFQGGGRRHLGFSKFQILNCQHGQEVELPHRAKFHRNR